MSESVQSIEKLVGEGRFLEARAMAQQLLLSNPDKRVKQLLGLSMAKSGALKAAMETLEPVYREDPADPETSGILGSIYKESFKLTRNSKYALLSRDTYLNNFTTTGSYYTGINAASMYAISGSMSKAREIARSIIDMLKDDSSDPWELATLAEAYVLLKERDKALNLYLKCRNLLGSDWGKVSSIYNQLWLLNHYVPVSNQAMSIFSPPVVAAFVGHMIDHPSRAIPRFPDSIEVKVKEGIRGAISSVNAKIGFCSLACGSDILFAEAIIESGGEINLFLPFDEGDFIKTSVVFGGAKWEERYRKLVTSHAVTYVTRERYLGNDELFTFQSSIIFGAAVRRAAMLHGTPHLITVFSDADVKVKEGGTRDTLKLWPITAKKINVNPQHFITEAPLKKVEDVPTPPPTVQKDERRHIRYLLSINQTFPVNQVERFHHFMKGRIEAMQAEHVDRTPTRYLFSFNNHKEAVTLAFEVQKFAAGPHVKLSLHAGPIYINKEAPFIEGPGTQLIEDISTFTLPGKIFASFQFATVLSVDSGEYAVEFAGSVSSTTGERLEIYRLNRHADAFDL